jgi:DnaJ-class molecular chaperone
VYLVAAASTVLLLLMLGYAIACAVRPFADCRRCHGSGQRRSSTEREHRRCSRCRGTGIWLRAGRRAFDLLRAEYRRVSR